jgi:hypothetical protein
MRERALEQVFLTSIVQKKRKTQAAPHLASPLRLLTMFARELGKRYDPKGLEGL